MGPDQRTDGDSDLEAPTAPAPPVPSAFAVPSMTPPSPQPTSARTPLAGIAFGVLGGLVGGALAALLTTGATGLGASPAPQADAVSTLERRIATLEQGVADTSRLEAIGARVAALETRPTTPVEDASRGDSEALATRLNALEARLNEREGSDRRVEALAGQAAGVAEIERRVAALEALEGRFSALEGLERRVSAVESLNQRLAALDDFEQRLAALQRRVDEQPLDERSARAVALAALQNALSRGAPFETELATFERLAEKPDPRLAALKPHAGGGVPTSAALRDQLPAVTDAVADALAVAEADGVLDRLLANARSAVRVHTTEPVQGSSPEAVLSRVDAALAASEPGRALAEWRSLPEPARTSGRDFGEKLAARAAAEDAMTALAAALAVPSAE